MKKIRRYRIEEAFREFSRKNPEKEKYNTKKLSLEIMVSTTQLSRLNNGNQYNKGGYCIPKSVQFLYELSLILNCDIEDFYILDIGKTKKLKSLDIKNMINKSDSSVRLIQDIAKKIGMKDRRLYQKIFYYRKEAPRAVRTFYNICKTLNVSAKDLIEV